MAELSIPKRVIFPSGEQKTFLCDAQKKLNIPSIKLARLLKISNRTLTDWKKEKFSMSFKAFKTLLGKTNMKAPKNIKLKDAYWYARKSAKSGGVAVYKKYGKIGGDPEYRKNKWYEWWERKGKNKIKNNICLPKPIKKPIFSKELAEFVGIMLGDGGIWKYQIYITLHDKDDKEYSLFVIGLIKKLFNVPVTIFRRKSDSTIRILVSRIKLVNFCVQNLSLEIGNKIKQQVDIPDWVKKNKSFSIACLRGLFDTDGCVFNHRYKVNGKSYNYKKISFTSHSISLLQSAFKILDRIGIKARVTKSGKDIRIDGQSDVKKYFKLIDSNNPKYLKKYRN